ncbi:hypothetical protein PV11_02453 [Exophiala sideris]|uniref:Methyltransferase domain-containing protein n=1 Tax=Exophiala sideris TaxID=1016849 RepID=A0A0D1XFG4_9EURO|nr:hypothetical protein PV11_02453 [Exophiala sideris]
MVTSTTHPVGDNAFLQRAYALSNTDEARDLYNDWASRYDKDLEDEDYAAPKLAVDALIQARGGSLDDTRQLESVRILDAGCGTGLVGLSLARFGARDVDGLDISAGMLEVARRTGVYGLLEEADLTKPIAKSDDFYDVVICVGTLTQGHVGPQVLEEFVRVIKSKGFIVATILDDIWVKDGFKAEVDRLSDQVRVLKSDVIGFRTNADAGGRLLVLQKT